MATKDIYKIDNYFITIGVIFLLLGAISILADPRTYTEITITSANRLTFEDWDGRTEDQIRQAYGENTEIYANGFPMIRTIVVANGLLLLIVGMAYRATERKIISVWDALDRSGEARVPALALSLGLTREFILKHLKDINAQHNTYYVWDSEMDKIADGKLMAEYMFVATCPSCGNSISQKIKLNFSSPPKCAYCGTSAAVTDLNRLKQDVMENRFVLQPTENGAFSVGVFILLLVIFWPAAFIYLFVKKSNASKSIFAHVAYDQSKLQNP
jgi:hypothetical protein